MENNLLRSLQQFSICLLFFFCGKTELVSQIISQTYSYTGAVQTLTVPSCVYSLTLDVKGAQGGSNANASTAGGLGGTAYGVLSVTPGDVLYIYTGGNNGYNGGGHPGATPCQNAAGGYGGGASDIRLNGTALNNRIIVAGGGGGAGGDRILSCGRGSGGGGGGGYFGGGGGSGFPMTSTILPTGGTQASGGSFGTSAYAVSQHGTSGSVGAGGNGGQESLSNQNASYPALPGGHAGGSTGANGHQPSTNAFTGQSGAGGSSYIGGLTNAYTITGNRIGHGLVTVSWSSSIPVTVSASGTNICAGSVVSLSTASLQSYLWSTGTTASSINVMPNTSTVYSLSGVNGAGCPVSGMVSITVNPFVPIMNIAYSASSVCPNHSVSLTASGADSYLWSNNIVNGVAFIPAASAVYTVVGTNACGNSTTTAAVAVNPLPISVAFTPSNVCANKSTTLSASGAAAYTWHTAGYGSLAPLQGANLVLSPNASIVYTVTGHTSQCSGTTVFSLQVNPNPVVNIVASSSLVCMGDSVHLNATGALTYSWNTGGLVNAGISVSPTVATLYAVTGVNAFNCSMTAYQPVLVNLNPVLSVAASDPVVCSGAPSTLSVSGASTYVWSTSAGDTLDQVVVNPLVSSNYSVTGTSTAGCVGSTQITIDIFTPTIAVSSNTIVCLGTELTIGAFGGDSYTWTPNYPFQYNTITPLVSNIYSVTATVSDDNGVSCAATATVSVGVDVPQVSISATRTLICKGEQITLNAGGSGSYLWSGPSTVAGKTSETVQVAPVADQCYTVTGTDANGCSATSVFNLKVTHCLGVDATSADQAFSIYPNPSQGEFTLRSAQAGSLNIVDETGRLVRQVELSLNTPEIKISDLDNGIYFVTGIQEHGIIKQKLIVAK